MANYTQDFFTSRRNQTDGNSRIGDTGRLWYDSISNTIRVSDGVTPGGILVSGAGGATVSTSEPTSASTGDLWYNPTSELLYVYYNGAWDPVGGGSSGGAVLVQSDITSVVAGWTIDVLQDYTNPSYPGGVYTLVQNAPAAMALSGPTWFTTGSQTKNGYTDYAAGTINVDDINFTVSISTGTFDIQDTDFIALGSLNITGANITGLGITGSSSTVFISRSLLNNTVQTTSYVPISARLTTTSGQKTAAGIQLINRQPVLYTITNAGSFPAATVPFFSLDQAFNWVVYVTGTTANGTTTLSGSGSQTLTNTGQTAGSSVTTYDSSAGTYTLTSVYGGAGSNGAGSRSVTATSNIPLSSVYYPLFYKITGDNNDPNFTTSDTYIASGFALGQGATTSVNPSEYTWLAIPTRIYSGIPKFQFDQPGFTGIVASVDQSYPGIDIGGETYNVYGFTNYSTAVYLYTASP